MGKSTSVLTKEQNNRRDCVRSCLVRQEHNTYLTVCLSLFNLKYCTVGHTGTGTSQKRSAKRFWTCGPLLLPQQWTVARLMGEVRTPSFLDRVESESRPVERENDGCIVLYIPLGVYSEVMAFVSTFICHLPMTK